MKVALRKLWKLARAEETTDNRATDMAESAEGLPDKVRKSCDALWLEKHGYALMPGRKLVGQQLRPMFDMSHAQAPAIKDFPLLAVRRMRLQDNSVQVCSNDAELKEGIQVFIRVRAFLYSLAFVNMDNTAFWDLATAELTADRILTFIHTTGPHGRPPVSYLAEAWDATSRVFQLAVRGGTPLKEIAAAESNWQHNWTSYTPAARPNLPNQSDQPNQFDQSRRGRRGKGEGKNEKAGVATAEQVRKMQQRKDKEISDLKRDLRASQQGSGSGSQGSSSWSKWPRRR